MKEGPLENSLYKQFNKKSGGILVYLYMSFIKVVFLNIYFQLIEIIFPLFESFKFSLESYSFKTQ